ncbi:MAG TPA: hypothetical protein VH475_01210 [Tepidisphaeraceae bacterium]|jgi:hypothetical protein
MPSLTCWCGEIIREDGDRPNCGHVLWDNAAGFYDRVASELLSFVQAQAGGRAGAWVKEHFEESIAPYEMTAGEAAESIVYQVSEGFCSGIYRCPKCGRIHIQVLGKQNKWESFVPERRTSDE